MDANDTVIAFLPCRKGSERVPQKNVRPFGPFGQGLVQIKLAQLLASAEIDQVVLSTNDDQIIEFASSLNTEKLLVHRRAEHLSSSTASTDALVGHARDLIPEGHILWTHVTSPFVTAAIYSKIITAYRQALMQGHDSLMTTTLLHTFLWSEDGPINYNRNVEKWPRTQTLKAVHEINSAVFLAPSEIYARLDDRIGENPHLFPLDRLIAQDIDWEVDFVMAEQLLLKGLALT